MVKKLLENTAHLMQGNYEFAFVPPSQEEVKEPVQLPETAPEAEIEEDFEFEPTVEEYQSQYTPIYSPSEVKQITVRAEETFVKNEVTIKKTDEIVGRKREMDARMQRAQAMGMRGALWHTIGTKQGFGSSSTRFTQGFNV